MDKVNPSPVINRSTIACVGMVVGLWCFYVFTLNLFSVNVNVWTNRVSATDAVNLCQALRNNTKLDVVDDPVKSLIDDLKERTRLAADSYRARGGIISSSLSAEEVAEWEKRNPCRSRRELAPLYSLRRYAKDLPVNPVWEEIFREYSNYHRTCMKAVGDIAEYFSKRDTSTGCQFVVADSGQVGVGNKLQVMANSILYGMITRRVILLPTSNLVNKYVCEPFVGSSWVLDSAKFTTPPDKNRKRWAITTEVFDHIDNYKNSCRHQEADTLSPRPSKLPYAAGDTMNQQPPFEKWYLKQAYQRFYCPTEQSFYSKITWIYLTGCIYTIPKFFAIPTFRPTLEALFPDKVVLTRLFRSMLLPADSVWTRVTRLHGTYLQPADRRVGIQMRYLYGLRHFNDMHELINERVIDCVLNQQILPQMDKSPNDSGNVQTNSTRTISVLVTSLYLSLHDKLSKMYMQYPTTRGDTVAVVQLTHEDKQRFGVDVDIQAFAEILLLSLSDDLLLTPISTFGGSAQAYGALTPWFIEYRRYKLGPSCERGRSVEVCGQYTSKSFDCKHDPDLGHNLFSDVVSFIEDCPQIEFPYVSETEQGIHLRTTFLS